MLERIDRLEQRVDEMETQCAIVHLDTQKRRANARTKKTWSQPIPMQARWITSTKDLEELEASVATQKERREKQAQAKTRSEARKAINQAERLARGRTVAFTRPFSSKNKGRCRTRYRVSVTSERQR